MKLLVFDGNSIINRAFYGVRPLTTRDGLHTNAIYGFINIYLKVMEDERPDGVAVAFDLPGPTFRHERYAQYKAHRSPMPEELRQQIPILKQLLDEMGVTRMELPGYEADDIIGAIASRSSAAGDACVIVTGDRDDLQLVDDFVVVRYVSSRGGRTETVLYDPARVREEYGFDPPLIVDYKALMGDPSDNIPGVAGIGDKTARALVGQYGGVDDIYAGLAELPIKDGVRKKLEAGREQAMLSRELATIDRAAPIECDGESMRPRGPQPGLKCMLLGLEFKSLLPRIAPEDGAPAPSDAADGPAPLGDAADIGDLAAGRLALAFDGLELCVSDGRLALERQKTLDGEFERTLEGVFAAGPVALHDKKAALHTLHALGVPPGDIGFDTYTAGYVLNPSKNSYSLETLMMERENLELSGGARAASAAIARLAPDMERELEQNGQTALYRDIELPLSEVLFDMERAGMLVEREGIQAFGDGLHGRIAELEGEIYSLAGGEFNINSPKQLGEVLFDRLGLPVLKKNKTGYSTDADVLEKLSVMSPVVRLILEYRSLTKLRSTYVDGLLKVIGPDGRIHSTFNQTVTQTGRISSTDPNMQNIPVREQLGRELRRYFTAPEGSLLIDADYSQIELRVLAHISGDPTMIDAFRRNLDIHSITAMQVFGVDEGEITSELRRRAKAVNFGIVYGIGEYSLSQDIGVSIAEAKRYIEGYFRTYPLIKQYLDRSVDDAKRLGYAATIFGRRRYLPELKSGNRNIRAFGERVAMNMPIQGAAADIIKIAMVRVHRRLRDEGLRARLILQVHDELIIEAPLSERDRAQEILAGEMENAMQMAVPLVVDLGVGRTWFDAKS